MTGIIFYCVELNAFSFALEEHGTFFMLDFSDIFNCFLHAAFPHVNVFFEQSLLKRGRITICTEINNLIHFKRGFQNYSQK